MPELDATTVARLQHETVEDTISRTLDGVFDEMNITLRTDSRFAAFTIHDQADQIRDLPDMQLAALFLFLFDKARPGFLLRDDYQKAMTEVDVQKIAAQIISEQRQLALEELRDQALIRLGK